MFLLIRRTLNSKMLSKYFQIVMYLLIGGMFVRAKIIYQTKPFDMISRSTAYKPKVISKMCLLRPAHGPCRGNLTMWAFYPMGMNCTTFNWGGCQGNGNRFFTEQECKDTCLNKPRALNTNQHHRPKYCSLRFDYGYCFGDIKRWYYDRLWGTCKETIYSGCGGNKNNFYSKDKCDQICRFGNIDRLQFDGDDIRKRVIVNPTAPVTLPDQPEETGTTGPCDALGYGLTTLQTDTPIFSPLIQLLNNSITPTIFYDLGIKAAEAEGVSIDVLNL